MHPKITAQAHARKIHESERDFSLREDELYHDAAGLAADVIQHSSGQSRCINYGYPLA